MADERSPAQKAYSDVSPSLADLSDRVLFGEVWERPGLSKRDRSLITVASLVAIYRGNALRVMAEAVRWGKRGARVNTISPGIVITPLAKDELTGPCGEGYRRMIELCPVGRAATPDEVGAVGALLMGPDGAFITVPHGWRRHRVLLVRRTRPEAVDGFANAIQRTARRMPARPRRRAHHDGNYSLWTA
jgi:hypothetical protein